VDVAEINQVQDIYQTIPGNYYQLLFQIIIITSRIIIIITIPILMALEKKCEKKNLYYIQIKNSRCILH
jgi:hypothetical protein